MQIIGIDIGTTTISGAVLEYENEKTVKLLEAKTIENGGFMPPLPMNGKRSRMPGRSLKRLKNCWMIF